MKNVKYILFGVAVGLAFTGPVKAQGDEDATERLEQTERQRRLQCGTQGCLGTTEMGLAVLGSAVLPACDPQDVRTQVGYATLAWCGIRSIERFYRLCCQSKADHDLSHYQAVDDTQGPSGWRRHVRSAGDVIMMGAGILSIVLSEKEPDNAGGFLWTYLCFQTVKGVLGGMAALMSSVQGKEEV